MSNKKRISDFDQISSISNEDEFILVDKSNTTDQDASDTGKTVKINFADMKNAISESVSDRTSVREPVMVNAWHMGPSYPYASSAFESDGTPTNFLDKTSGCNVLYGLYKRYPSSSYNYSDFASGESPIMGLKENGVFDIMCTTTSIPSSDRVDHEILFYDFYNSYIGKWDFYSSGSAYYIDLYNNDDNLIHTFNGAKHSGLESEWMVGSSSGGGRIAATFKLKDQQLKVFPYYTSSSMNSKYYGGDDILTETLPSGWPTTAIHGIKVNFKNIRGRHPAAYAWIKIGNGYNSALFDYDGNHTPYVNSWRNSGEILVY